MEEEEKKDAALSGGQEAAEKQPAEAKKSKKKSKKLNWKFLTLLIALVLAAVAYSAYANGKLDPKTTAFINQKLGIQTLSNQEAQDFINKYFMSDGTGVTVSSVTEENGLFKIVFKVGEQEYTAYLTKDRSVFFPQAINMAEFQKQLDESQTSAEGEVKDTAAEEVAKTDKPVVELFVMSHCPYGTQIEKGIIPVVKALGDKIDFELKFCSYAMHGEKELQEEMNQYAITKNAPDKLLPYLECFLKSDGTGSADCAKQVGIDGAKLSAWASAIDSEFKVMANFADQSTWSGSYPGFNVFKADNDKYGISGSPSLVINGTKVSSARDSQSLLNSICNGFTTAPQECANTLSTETPTAGFGSGTASSGDASCGS